MKPIGREFEGRWLQIEFLGQQGLHTYLATCGGSPRTWSSFLIHFTVAIVPTAISYIPTPVPGVPGLAPCLCHTWKRCINSWKMSTI